MNSTSLASYREYGTLNPWWIIPATMNSKFVWSHVVQAEETSESNYPFRA